MWIDPRKGDISFDEFATELMESIGPRLEPSTLAKYRSHLDNHLLPQWAGWPLIGIFNSYMEIEKWVSELHEDYAESTVASIFATFSTFLKVAARAQHIPANPCSGIRVTSGEFDPERLVATPVQVLRAAMRLYHSAGPAAFVLTVMDAYTGGRWSELVGQQRHEYSRERPAIRIQEPLKELGGKLFKGGRRIGPGGVGAGVPTPSKQKTTRPGRGRKKGRTKTPAGTRDVLLAPSIAALYETLMDSHEHPFIFCTPEGNLLRRSNFRQRHWRPAWDGVEPDNPRAKNHVPSILMWFTFHEGRHTHSTWLAEDGVCEIARRARLGQKMKGIGRVYDHVTPEMERQVLDVLEARWRASVAALTAAERAQLMLWFPCLRELGETVSGEHGQDQIAESTPNDQSAAS
ncbi:site-specific integrase [Saccharopolyspora antimicrobica]|nr:site-specific integrase [Saccharopolyspora antimicrobica]